MPAHHIMQFVRQRHLGVGEWRCPHCNRRVLVNVVRFSIIELERGDGELIHVGGLVPLMAVSAESWELSPIDKDDNAALNDVPRAFMDYLRFLDRGGVE